MKRAKVLAFGLGFLGLAIGVGLLLRPQTKNQLQNGAKQPEGTVAVEVKMTDDGFEPANFTIKDGQAVRFSNVSQSKQHWPASNIHPAHDLYPEFDVKRGMAPGESWVFTFRRKGLWPMHDHLMPYLKGTITVE